MRSLTTHSPLRRWSRRRIGEQEKGSPGPTNMWGHRVCVCRSASAALRSPSISGTALHPTNAPRETLVGKGMIHRPPREAIVVSTPDPGRWRGEPFPIPHNPDPRDGGERASGRHVLRHGHLGRPPRWLFLRWLLWRFGGALADKLPRTNPARAPDVTACSLAEMGDGDGVVGERGEEGGR